jgi:hypothetical protein
MARFGWLTSAALAERSIREAECERLAHKNVHLLGRWCPRRDSNPHVLANI